MENHTKGGTSSTSGSERLGVHPQQLGYGGGSGSSGICAHHLPGVPGSPSLVGSLGLHGEGGPHAVAEGTDAPHADRSSEFDDVDLCTYVLSVDIVQSKSRYLGDYPGYVASGLRLRKRAELAVGEYRKQGMGVLFMTFTYDPAKWSDRGIKGAEECFKAIGPDRHWGEFLRRLEAIYPGFHVLAIMEFHPGGEDGKGEHAGWPHWHALLIGPTWYLPFSELTDIWGWGRVDGSRAGDDAIKYICKYMTKGMVPPAYMASFSRVHFTHTSWHFWDVLGPVEPRVKNEHPKERAACATIGEIRSRPDRYLRTMMRIILATGEELYHNANMNISLLVDILSKRMLGGRNAWDDGHASLVPVPASLGGEPVTLDYLLNCGDSVNGGSG